MGSGKKEELLKTLDSAYQELEGLIEEAGEAKLAEPGVTGVWSIRDLLAHMTAWEERIVAWAEALDKGTKPTPAPWPQGLDEEQVNAFIYESSRSRLLEDVVEGFRTIHQRVTDVVRGMSDQELFERKVDWLGDRAFADALPGNSFEHLRDHAQQIRDWLGEKAQSPE